MSKNINSILERIIQVQIQTINKINSLSINYQLPSSVVQLNQLGKIPEEYLNDYTAFEVFAHDYDIAADTLISNTELSSCIKHSELLTESIAVSLPAQMTHRFVIRSDYLPEEQNITVDWGDGTFVKLSDFSTVSGSVGDYKYTLQHTYTSNGKYIIKIYGNKYFAIIQSSSSDEPNILCRAIDIDLPVASHLRNFSSFCRHSKHLLEIDVYRCSNFNKNYINISSMFTGCSNLIYALGFSTSTKFNIAYTALFFSAVSLKKTDFCLIPTNMSIKQVFRDCKNLEVDIANILSIFRMPTKCSINTNTTFLNCSKLYGTIPEDVLWNDKQVTWSPTKTFNGCSDEIRAQVPKSWGGTALDDIIQKSIEQKFNMINQNLSILNQKFIELESKLV